MQIIRGRTSISEILCYVNEALNSEEKGFSLVEVPAMKSFVFLYFLVALSPIVTCQNSHRSFGRCPKFTIKKSTIIKSSQSVHNGAVLLGRKLTRSSAGCHKECCKNTDCNLVMLKYELQNKIVKITCFLFDCKTPSVCSFYQHSTYHSYVALDYGERKSSFKANDYHPRNKGIFLIIFKL